jgi:hypothetical protein
VKITQDATVLTDPVLSATLAEKDRLLESIINGSAAEAVWQLDGGDGRPGLNLYLRDQSGKRGSATFEPFELKSESVLAARLGTLGDALRKVGEWRRAVESLFARIRPWCASLPGNPHMTDGSTTVAEEQSGWYDVPELTVVRGRATLTITPVAAWVVGADGQVNMTGPGDRAVLEYTRATDSWYHVPNYLPYRELPLTESLFRELAEACLDA